MPTLAELKTAREEAGKHVLQMRDKIQADDYQATAEDDAAWEAANDGYNAALKSEEAAIDADRQRQDRIAQADQIIARAGELDQYHRDRVRPDYRGGDVHQQPNQFNAEEYNLALQAWAGSRVEDFEMTDRHVEACRHHRININSDQVTLPFTGNMDHELARLQSAFLSLAIHDPDELRFLAADTINTQRPDQGGYATTPARMLRQLEINMLAFGGLLQAATIITTSTREEITQTTVDDTTNKGKRIGEGKSLGTRKTPKFGTIKWGAYKYTSDIIPVTREQLSDPFFNVLAFVSDIAGERLGRIFNEEITRGTGASMPRGILTCSPVGVTTASATAITTDEVINLEHSVDPAYRSGRDGFMFHDSITAYLRKLKDGEGRAFYQLGQEINGRDRLNGKRININLEMDDTVAAGKTTMLYGDFRKYRVRRAGGPILVRDPYSARMTEDVDLFAMLIYGDGNMQDAGTPPVKALKQKAS